MNYQQLIKPELVNSVSKLAMVAKLIVEGYLNGLHHSRRVGTGMEFSQYRAYEKGDDLRMLDWKMLARSGRHYIKQSEVETNITTKFILDASKSMAHQEGDLSKFDYAKIIIATLAYLSQKQGDAIGLFALNNQDIHNVFPKIQKQHYHRMLFKLLDIEPQGKWPAYSNATNRFHSHSEKELVLFFTDFYEEDTELLHFVKRLKTNRNEVIVFHLMDHNELAFEYDKDVTFEDLETGTQVKVAPQAIKAQYLKQLNDDITAKKNFLLGNNIMYQLIRLDENIADTLTTFLQKRQRLL